MSGTATAPCLACGRPCHFDPFEPVRWVSVQHAPEEEGCRCRWQLDVMHPECKAARLPIPVGDDAPF
jgi:hypothetical protein